MAGLCDSCNGPFNGLLFTSRIMFGFFCSESCINAAEREFRIETRRGVVREDARRKRNVLKRGVKKADQ